MFASKGSQKLDRRSSIRQQIQDEASRLLSFKTLGKRMEQLDQIINRRASKVFFSMETETNLADPEKIAENARRKEKLVNEMLKKVKKRRKMMRSYTYLSWFCIFFISFLGELFLKEDNVHLYAVDNSIQNRIVEVLPSGSISENKAFYDWLAGVVSDIFPDTVCGNGVCEAEEFAGFGRFGCISDCGRYLQRTMLRVDTIPAWRKKPGGVELPQFQMGSGDNVKVQFSYNIFSETMNDYILAKDTSNFSAVVDVPDGNFWFELYQTTSVYLETPIQDIYDFAQAASGTLVSPKRMFDYQYGDAAEAMAVVAQINRQMRDYCTIENDGSTAFSGCPPKYNVNQMSNILRTMYGLSGNISISNGVTTKQILSFPFCSLMASDDGRAYAPLSPDMCGQSIGLTSGGDSSCYNATVLAQRFRCKSRYAFSIWAYGPPRIISVKPSFSPTPKSLTPFNNVIGSVIVSQYRRKESTCARANNDAVSMLTNQFSCQSADPGEIPFGIDPMFQPSSSLYNGKLQIDQFYAPNECAMVNLTDSNLGQKVLPFAFFPHQWGQSGLKNASLISPKDIGVYKLFFDSRLSIGQSKSLVQYMIDGMFLSDKTMKVEFEILTYNADFNLFGILTIQFEWDQGGGIFWDYQYNTAQLSPYSGLKGQLTIFLETLFGFMLIIDIIRESRDIYHALLREEVIQGYVLRFWNWIDWTHYGLLASSIGLWISYNTYITSLQLKSNYPVLKDLSSPCRLFATSPQDEYVFIEFTQKMRTLSEMKNLYTAINCLNITFFVVRILKILDFQPRMSLITRTLRAASIDLGHYFALFGLVFIAYASVGTLLLGDRIKAFQTFGSSCVELFMIFMGWEPLYRDMGKAAAQTRVNATMVSFLIFYWSWIMVATFLMLNVVLAIIVEAYSTVRSQMKDAPTIIHEAFIVCRENMQFVQNRLCGSEWYIKDSDLEKILVTQNRMFQSQKKLLDRVSQIRGKAKAVRLAGGLEVSEKDFEVLLHECGTRGKSLLAKARSYLDVKDGRNNRQTVQDGIEIEDDQDIAPPPAVENLIKRYGEVVPEGKDDEDLLEMIRTENMKRQMAMYTSQDELRQQISMAHDILLLLARHTLPSEEITKMETETLLKRSADGTIALELADIIARTSCLEGTLKVTVVAAKRLPKLDIFTESDPYCMLILEHPNVEDEGRIQQDAVGRTETKKNDQNPIWNSEFSIRVKCTNLTKLMAVILDKDEHGEDDLIGMAVVSVSKLPVETEVDKWYRLQNESAPHLTKRAMVRMKIHFSADMNGKANTDVKQPEDCDAANTSHDISTGDLHWLHEKLQKSVQNMSEKLGPRTLELTLISARHLPKRDAFFMKADPYVKMEFNGTEHESLVRKGTYSPDWGQSFLFRVDEASEIQDSLRLAVMDWDRFSRHDVIGFVELSQESMADMLMQDIGWHSERTFNLERKGKTVIGNDGSPSEVTVEFRIKEASESSKAQFEAVAKLPADDSVAHQNPCSSKENGADTDRTASAATSDRVDRRPGIPAPSTYGERFKADACRRNPIRARRGSAPRHDTQGVAANLQTPTHPQGSEAHHHAVAGHDRPGCSTGGVCTRPERLDSDGEEMFDAVEVIVDSEEESELC